MTSNILSTQNHLAYVFLCKKNSILAKTADDPLWLLTGDIMLNKLKSKTQGPGGSMSQVVGLLNNLYKPIINTEWVHAWLCKLQKGCTRLAAASDTVYQLLAHGRWFSPGTPVSSTTKTGRHDIVEILLKVALKTKKLKSIILCLMK